MIKQTIYIGQPSKLRLRQQQLAIEQTDALGQTSEVAHIPFEDLAVLVLDEPQVTVTTAVLRKLAEAKAVGIVCDESHHPCTLILPLYGNNLHTQRLRQQVERTPTLQKTLWARIVQIKIANQAGALAELAPDESLLTLVRLAKEVAKGDPDNHEGTAAAHYWARAFAWCAPDFTRDQFGDPPNNLLNYGYAILRALTARAVVSAGLHPSIGLFHKNQYNPFCLADDLMEAYRPYVDRHIGALLREWNTLPDDLTREHKAALLRIPALKCVLDGTTLPLQTAVMRTATSLVNCFAAKEKKLRLPVFEMHAHRFR